MKILPSSSKCFVVLSLIALNGRIGFAQSAVSGYSGETCEQTMFVAQSGTLRSFIARRVGDSKNLNFGGIDWVEVNKARNSHLKNPENIAAGDKLTIVTPRIPGIAVNPKAVCTGGDSQARSAQTEPKSAPVPGVPPVPPAEKKSVEPATRPINPAAPAVPRTDMAESKPTATAAAPAPGPVGPAIGKETPQEVAFRAYMMNQSRQEQKANAARLEQPAIASNAGFRAGMPVAKNSVLLPKMRLFNLFLQVKDGPLGGLTIFSDFVPKVKETFEDRQFEIMWQRGTLGWAFGFGFDSIIRRVELVPRLGFWQVRGVLPKRLPGGGGLGATEFKFQRQSLGLEGSVAFDFVKSTSFRLWHGRDVAKKFTGKPDKAAVSAQRTGLDFFFPGFDFQLVHHDFRFVGLVYAMHEAMFMTSVDVKSDKLWKVSNTDADGETFYGVVYGGLGFTITF